MKKSLLAGAAILFGIGSFITTVQAQSGVGADSRQFNPASPCSQILRTDNPTDLRMAGMWAFGYIARANDSTLVITPKRIRSVITLLSKGCARDGKTRFNALVEVLSLKLKEKAAGKTSTRSSNSTGGAALKSARALLDTFFKPGVNYAALTAALKPTENDIRSVYAEPLASALVKRNQLMFKPGIAIRPKPEHDTYRIFLSTTKKLQQGSPDLREFPGGYEKVRKYFIRNVPIVRFKFVTRGAKLGLAFDGLIFVNGRWVLIPKPWRGLK
ncbi:MAG TPA: hypothetical protein ENJ55_04720 [Rhizobiales bacterium]|nr:hypothetical protein [Hyphomicrobiales bacterium]